MREIRVVLVDDHHVVRKGLRSFLESYPDIRVVGEAASGEALLEKVALWQPDVVLLDLLLPGGIDGIETTRRLRSQFPDGQVVALTAYTDDARVVAALRAGVLGYVRKDADPELLLTAVRAAARGQSFFDPATAAALRGDLLQKEQLGSELTEREMDVLRLLGKGLSNSDIAGQLFLSEGTVRNYVSAVLAKLQVSDRTQAAVLAVKHGLVD